MVTLLVILLLFALVGLGFVGYYAFQLQIKLTRLDTELAAQRSRYDHDIKQWSEHSAAVKTQYQNLVNKYNEDVKRWNEHATTLKAEVQRLAKWKNVADAEVKAAEMLRTAQATLETAKVNGANALTIAQQRAAAMLADADQKCAAQVANANCTASTVVSEAEQRAAEQLASANDSASALLSEAREKSKMQKDEAQALLASATTQAARIVDAANKKAEDIAGSAYEAMNNASLYERTAKAMKNLIEGYGDEYLIPPHSLLDDLADDFGHVTAGRELKRARECTKVMNRNRTAATCDYVEANRRETAINFVVDAFNGKVDSILSRAKHDNAGKLEQEIRDAFTLVNYNGKAFRDARITEEYLSARIDELRWASIVQQLAAKERDEQRHVKEQAREEARAAKERERALREAAKEEETLQKAISQARQQFEQASGEQRAKYEERLREMAEKLHEAQERKERAVSMAQVTTKGHVYIISNVGSFGEDVFKIGLTRRWDPWERVEELGDASVPFGFDVHAMILSDEAPKLEQELHQHFVLKQMNKVNQRKEFFRVSLKELREEVDKLGLAGVKWTMTAEAHEYRKTVMIERAIKDDPLKRDAWIKRQLDLELADDVLLHASGTTDDEDN